MPVLAVGLVALWGTGLLIAGLTDLGRFVIPNRLNLFLGLVALLALLLALFGGQMDPLRALLHAAVAAATLAAGIVLFLRRYIGGGDAKLLAVLALWSGPADISGTLAGAVLLGGVFSLLILAFRALPLPATLLARPALARLHEKGGPVPYGVPIVAAGLMALPGSTLATALFALG